MVLASSVTTLSYTAYSLTNGVTYKFKVQARSAYGYSDFSAEVSILSAAVPDAPTNLANNPSETNSVQIGLTWTKGINDGGSEVIDYRVSYDQSNGNWVVFADGIT